MVILEPPPGRASRRLAHVALAAALCVIVGCATLFAQAQPQAPAQSTLNALIGAEPSGETFTLVFFNRPIVVLRARVLGRGPAERAASAVRVLDDLVAEQKSYTVESRVADGAALIDVGSRVVIGITSADIDELAGETLETVGEQTVVRLQQALDEAGEARTPGALLRSSGFAVAALTVGFLLLWVLGRTRRIAAARLAAISERTVARSGLADVDALRASRLLDLQHWLVTAVTIGLQILVVYGLLTFDLQLFPYTRRWGESLSGYLVDTIRTLGLGVVYAIPGLFTVALIFLMARVVTRVSALWFNSVERGHIRVSWLFPETAQPTRRLLSTLIWVFAIVVAYPYMPGSGTDAFKGVSVFLGLMLTFGSSGLVNQIMSGFMVTYSRALRVGDFVRIGDIEGTVTHLGVLSTKVKTLKFEEVTIPNAVVVSQTTTDYSRHVDTDGVLTSTSVTIGYDAPWRQVQSLMLLAAERTSGIRREPKPFVLQRGLEDFYVRYELFFSLEQQEARWFVLDALHAHIQDLFNEYGVQIMSPNYVFDPAAPKVVARKDWFAAPAAPSSVAGARSPEPGT